ncbi:hypothetical protein OsJ_08787 [Oryza sativa Japonica Group]|uniref:Uncharacterized protein n=1 Tax=Oryza sativa subsp. japonica TaxID=39947 RepID=B9F446_ORYSJ|nr:hypothetical protein OsJ_08787 [Oryza sativa Japonica Group]
MELSVIWGMADREEYILLLHKVTKLHRINQIISSVAAAANSSSGVGDTYVPGTDAAVGHRHGDSTGCSRCPAPAIAGHNSGS